jgi:VanZ family protein
MFIRYLYPPLLWAAFILLLTITSGKEFPEVTLISFDKAIHFFLFIIQSYLLARGFIRQSAYMTLRYHPLLWSFFISLFFGATTEIIQAYMLTDRTGDIFDFAANGAGSIAGIVIFVLLYGKPNYANRET